MINSMEINTSSWIKFKKSLDQMLKIRIQNSSLSKDTLNELFLQIKLILEKIL